MKLTTPRLILRQPTMKDAKSIVRNINNINISKWLLVVPFPYTMKDAKWFVNHVAEKSKERPRKDYFFNIQLKDQEDLIGCVGLHHLNDKERNPSLGYWLGEDYHRQGIMREAANRVLDYGFNDLHLRKIEIPVFATNIPSATLAQRLGGRYMGMNHKLQTCRATGKKHKEKKFIVTPASWRRSLRR